MSTTLFSVAVIVAALCAGLMGYAIQRGATCAVAAVDELLSQRKAARLLAIGEASLWVAGGLALASVFGLLPAIPAAYPARGWVVAGGVLLGLGAWINRACVFGAVAKFGSGDWSYAATPIGFYVGCLSVGGLFAAPAAVAVADTSPVLRVADVSAVLFVAFAAWRIVPALAFVCESKRLGELVWAPHAATGVIGVTFVLILLLVGVWAYTDVLAQLARGMSMRLALGALLLLALYLGALLGGWTAGRLRSTPPSAAGVLRCFTGGVLMAWGSLLIPGSNDGLILIGMPLLHPYAWLAFVTMCVTVAAAQLLRNRFAATVPVNDAA
jgi:hypothetical protein